MNALEYQKPTNFSSFFQFIVRWCHIQLNWTHSQMGFWVLCSRQIIFWRKNGEKKRKKSSCTSNWNLLPLFHPRQIHHEFLISLNFLCRCFFFVLVFCVCVFPARHCHKFLQTKSQVMHKLLHWIAFIVNCSTNRAKNGNEKSRSNENKMISTIKCNQTECSILCTKRKTPFSTNIIHHVRIWGQFQYVTYVRCSQILLFFWWIMRCILKR